MAGADEVAEAVQALVADAELVEVLDRVEQIVAAAADDSRGMRQRLDDAGLALRPA